MKALRFLRARLSERSTYMFMFGSIGTVAALSNPWSIVGGVVLGAAALFPDPAKPEKPE